MTPYNDAGYHPPAPVALVSLRNPATGEQADDVALLIDSGADATLVPRTALMRIRVEPIADAKYQIEFINRVYKGRFLITDSLDGVLGRDVLNHVALVLDGPSRQWSEIRR